MKARQVVSLLFGTVWFAAGCALFRGPDLLEQGVVCARQERTGAASLRSLSVTQEGSSLLVVGAIDGGVPASEQVKLTLVGPDGKTLASGVGRAPRGNRRLQGRRFSVSLPAVAPEGSTLRIAY